MMNLYRMLRDSRASVTIEFALASLFLFGTIMVALDYGFNVQERLKLGHAVEQAAVLAYNQQTGSDTSAVSSYVANAAHTKNMPTVAITCNGTSSCGSGTCSCITSTGGFTTASACNTTCSGSSAVSGNYMKIVATATYNSVIVPDKWLGGTTITSTAVVRLQ